MQGLGSIEVASSAQNLDSPLMEQAWTVTIGKAFGVDSQKQQKKMLIGDQLKRNRAKG